ncbi:TIGR03943 family protein [Actinomyces sp. B33]|uniref:TIGR03943 family putative permease subunit n=1 Tax=Actinomyces sp. B33 TaxID=2942131 RepID=UPI00234174D9|nr:TIGR03943 family protein [Actinomyces sp. B33]MDC4232727.1 TIGR03943 family protein [Actinomyces sp. B33]
MKRSTLSLLAALVASCVILCYAATGRLVLYVHPRHVLLSALMAAIGLIGSIGALALRAGDDHEDHGAATPGARGRLAAGGSALLVIAMTCALGLVPAASLSASSAARRAPVGAAAPLAPAREPTTLETLPERPTVRDWSDVSASTDPRDLDGRDLDVDGFVMVTDSLDEDTYWVARFAITCCALDAIPVGVPVRDPGWRNRLQPGDWVRLSGTFTADEPAPVDGTVLVRAESVVPIDEPDDPYVY